MSGVITAVNANVRAFFHAPSTLDIHGGKYENDAQKNKLTE